MAKISKDALSNPYLFKSFDPSQGSSEIKKFVLDLSPHSNHYPISISEIDKCSVESIKKILFTQLVILALEHTDPETVQRGHTAYLSQISRHCKQNNTSLAKMQSPKEVAILTKHFNNAEHWTTIEEDGTEKREVKPSKRSSKEIESWQQELETLLMLALGTGFAAKVAPVAPNARQISLAKQVRQANLFPINTPLRKRSTQALSSDVDNLGKKFSYSKEEMRQMMKTEEVNARKKASKDQESLKKDFTDYKKRKEENQQKK